MLGVVVAAAVVWLAALGVRERALLADAPAPPLRLARLVVRAAVLFVTTCFAFALFESWEHWRAGLGWHGLHCLTGPAHRNAIPILAALSLVAAALAAALEHVLAWMRRTIASLRARATHDRSPRLLRPAAARPRGHGRPRAPCAWAPEFRVAPRSP